jgi:conjugal transfer pilus assembly protein TraF
MKLSFHIAALALLASAASIAVAQNAPVKAPSDFSDVDIDAFREYQSQVKQGSIQPVSAEHRLARQGGDAGPVEVQLGDDFYCAERRLGAWFYCEKPKAEDREKTKQSEGSKAPSMSASDKVKAITRRLDELRDKAILEPTAENVISYIQYQNAQSDRASKFADVWERSLISNPELDYNLQRPVSTLGKQVWTEERKATLDRTMAQLKDRYGVFYFYSGQDCASCDVQAPIISSLRDNYGLTVMGITSDGFAHPLFPQSMADQGQRERMGLPGDINPTVALYDTLAKRSILIGSGILSSDEIVNRIFLLTQTQPGEDY